MAVRVGPITDADIRPAAEFLHLHLNARLSADEWARAMTVPWVVDAPNHGYLIRAGDEVVGVHLAFYSTRLVDGAVERFCNLGAWCVLPAHRPHSLRLLTALLAQPGYTFTDLSPSGPVIPLNTRLRFRTLDATTALLPNLPWPTRPGRVRISDDPSVIENTLTGDQLELYRDHARTAAARHLVLTRGDQSCYLVYRRDRRRNLPLFASILYVSHPELFRRAARAVSRYLLVRHGIPATLAEVRVVGGRPVPSVLVRPLRQRMYRTDRLAAEQIDYLYSELVCVAW